MENFYLPFQEQKSFVSSKSKLKQEVQELTNRIKELENIVLSKETTEALTNISNLKENESLTTTIYSDVVLETEALNIKQNTSVELNVKDVLIEAQQPNVDTIIVNPNATLTINGNGTFKAANGGNGFPIISSGKLVINNGTFVSGYDENNKANACVYAKGNGQIEIYGGRFETFDGTFVLNIKDSDRETASIKAMGGEYVNFNPSNNASEGQGTNFVPEGYKVVYYKEDKNTIYKVIKA